MKRTLLTVAAAFGVAAAEPNLVMTEKDVQRIEAADTLPPLFAEAMDAARSRVDASIMAGIDVPLPKDPGGGPTHERHKANGKLVYEAGMLYALTGEKAYKDHARDILMAYAEMYPGLNLHPERKNQGPGKLFWQHLNESVFLVYAAQGYDAIAEALEPPERREIENGALFPIAEFLSTESAATFDKIHNHGTWAAAAVGMTGLATGREDLYQRALYGLDGSGEAGFLKQLDLLFSPDGYYTEGPYYQRYALMPFVLFAAAIDANDPNQDIFGYRDGILLKAIEATIQQSYGGRFFPVNDAIKEKRIDTVELVYGVGEAYKRTGNPGLLSIARLQGQTVLTGGGYNVALAIEEGRAEPYQFRTQLLSDGANGDQGAFGILRSGLGGEGQTVVVKNTGQGMGHGHFDRLGIVVYDQGREIVSDYGAARFLNVPSKAGGRYLPENNSFAKQTVAHNTLVVDEASQYGGDWRRGQEDAPQTVLFVDGSDHRLSKAVMTGGYPGVRVERTVVQIDRVDASPLVLDIVKARSDKRRRYDLPFWYQGQLIERPGAVTMKIDTLRPLGSRAGYQHLWRRGEGRFSEGEGGRFTFLEGRGFFTYHLAPSEPTEAILVRTGANDPDDNLRAENAVLYRRSGTRSTTFVTLLEPHGIYAPSEEYTIDSTSQVETFRHRRQDEIDIVHIQMKDGSEVTLALAEDLDGAAQHSAESFGQELSWTGPYTIKRN